MIEINNINIKKLIELLKRVNMISSICDIQINEKENSITVVPVLIDTSPKEVPSSHKKVPPASGEIDINNLYV